MTHPSTASTGTGGGWTAAEARHFDGSCDFAAKRLADQRRPKAARCIGLLDAVVLAQGTAASPIIFTAERDDTAGDGNRLGGLAAGAIIWPRSTPRGRPSA